MNIIIVSNEIGEGVKKKHLAVHQNSEDVPSRLWIGPKPETINNSFQGKMSIQRME